MQDSFPVIPEEKQNRTARTALANKGSFCGWSMGKVEFEKDVALLGLSPNLLGEFYRDMGTFLECHDRAIFQPFFSLLTPQLEDCQPPGQSHS